MPLLRNKFQPYFPDPDAPKNEQCGDAYCHPLALGDIIYSQFFQTPCNPSEIEDPTFGDYTLGAEELTNGTFTGNANGWETVSGVLPNDGWAYDSNNIEHTAGSAVSVFQDGLALTAGYYQVEIDITRTDGSVRVIMGDGPFQTLSDYYDSTGVFTFIMYYSDVADQIVQIEPTSDFAGWINSISVKEITYNSWEPNASWLLQDGFACHITGTTGLLEETVANYIQADEYYELTLTATGVTAGSCDVYISDVNVGTITSSGTFSYYGTPTVAGVLSFDPTSDFVGCIDFTSIPDADRQTGLYLLNNNHLAYVVDPDGNEYQIGQYFDYWERYVTLVFDISILELPYDCYTLKVVDACIVEGLNVVSNPDFTDGSTDWSMNVPSTQYSFGSNQLSMNFTVSSGTDYITNGDFATGDFTGWTAGANWAVVGNAAVHTPGSTATLSQTVALPAYIGPPVSIWYFLKITMSGRTAGSLSFTLGNVTRSSYNSNDDMTIGFTEPNPGGSISFTITPTSDFDGTIDDIQLYRYDNFFLNSVVRATNVANPLTIAGNYEAEFEIISTTDTRIGVGIRIVGQTQSITYFNTVGVHTVSIPNYVPGSQQVQIVAVFEEGNYGVEGTVVVDNIDVHPVEPFEATYTSECLNYQLEHTDTRMIVAYCDQEALGFEFTNTGFIFAQRVECRSLNPVYPGEMLIQKSGNGDARLTYGDLEKYWLFATGFISETAHDALAAMVRCDHVQIGLDQGNLTEYLVQPDEYTPQWRGEGDYSLSTVSWLLRIKSGGQVFNRHT